MNQKVQKSPKIRKWCIALLAAYILLLALMSVHLSCLRAHLAAEHVQIQRMEAELEKEWERLVW